MVRRNENTPLDKPKLLITKEEADKIRAANKRRAKAMEKEVCRYLEGNRTPMSGAGFVKGDGLVNLDFGIFVVECKVTAKAHKGVGPTIRIQSTWISTLHQNIYAMRGLGARAGCIVIKYHTYKEKFVLIPDKYISLFESLRGQQTVDVGGVLKSGRVLTSIVLPRTIALANVGNVVSWGNELLHLQSIENLKTAIVNLTSEHERI